jgi:hypothetical protein
VQSGIVGQPVLRIRCSFKSASAIRNGACIVVHRPSLSTTPRALPAPPARARFVGLLALLAACTALRAAPGESWPLAGQQGLVRFVIVPADQARDRAAYDRQIQLLCEPERTCFLNFFTNSTGAPLAVPLPDAIDHEATAVFRRSAKRGAETFRWRCRLQIPQEDCF